MAAAPPPLLRSPRFWAPRLAVLAGAVAAGLLLQGAVAARLAAIQALAGEDVVAARAELAALFRLGGAALFGLTGAVGASIAWSSHRAIAAGRYPPPGIWSWGAVRSVTGPAARRMARAGVVLGILVLLLSAAGAALAWHMAAVLLACRAV